MERATILIIDHLEGNTIKSQLEKIPDLSVIGYTNNTDLGFTMAERHQPTVIILNVDLPESEGLSVAEVFALELPASSLILMTSSDSRRVLRHALQVGAKDVINLPVDDEQLFRVINRVIKQEQKRRQLFTVLKKEKPQFKTITVFGTKGGVGKTTLALNLAIAIRQFTQKRVVLVDLDLMSGNVGLMAGVTSKRSIKELIDDMNNIDDEGIDNYCINHPTGLKILPAPVHPEYAGLIGTDHVEKVLTKLTKVFNYVVVDTPAFFHDTVIPALEQASDILMVTTLDLASIQNLKQCFEILAGLSMRSKARLVVNRTGYGGGLKIDDLEEELGVAVQGAIPDCEKQAIDAINLGQPIILSANNSVTARRLEELAKVLMTVEDHTQTKIGKVGFLGRR